MAQQLPVVQSLAGPLSTGVASELYAAFLAGRSENTLKAYVQDLQAFAVYRKEATPQAALDELLRLPHGAANGVLLGYRAHMADAGLTPATINRRLTAVRSAVKLGRTLGMTAWVPEIDGLKVQAFRDTRGPGVSGTKAMLDMAMGQRTVKAARDAAMIRLFFDLGLRRGEVASLDVEHIDVDSKRLWIKGKGRAQRESRSLPDATLEALQAWLAVRSQAAPADEPALFVNLSHRDLGRRITGRGLHVVIAELGKDAGLKTRPHGLRHASITAALDALNGDVRAAQQHARHSSPETTMRYDDNRKDLAGKVSRVLAGVLGEENEPDLFR